MKYLYAFTLTLLSCFIYSQNYEYIKKLDTIYVPFKRGKFNMKIDYPEEINGFKNRSYIFNFKKKNDNSFYFEFDRNKTSENKTVKKDFLKINKRKIVVIDSLKGVDYQDIACNFKRSKVIYIVDFSEKKGRRVKLYRVISMNLCHAIE